MKDILMKWTMLITLNLEFVCSFETTFTLRQRLKNTLNRGVGVNKLKKLNMRWSLPSFDIFKPVKVEKENYYRNDYDENRGWPNWGALITKETPELNIEWSDSSVKTDQVSQDYQTELNTEWSNMHLVEPEKYRQNHQNLEERKEEEYFEIAKPFDRIGSKSRWEDVFPNFNTRISGEASDDSAYTKSAYNLGHVNFHEIFSNSLSLLADDPLTSVTKDEDLHLHPSQYAEFRLSSYTTNPTTSFPTTTPPPRFLKAAYIHADDPDDKTSTSSVEPTISTTTASTTTTAPSTATTTTTTTLASSSTDGVRVVPLRNYQRGVLDLLLPASRVKNFKDVFESFKRLLSYTFRK